MYINIESLVMRGMFEENSDYVMDQLWDEETAVAVIVIYNRGSSYSHFITAVVVIFIL